MVHTKRSFCPSRCIWIISLLLLLFFSVCTNRQDDEVRELLWDFPDDLAHHLISSDDSTLAKYGREVGLQVLLDANGTLTRRTFDMYSEDHPRSAATLMANIKRIALLLESEFDYGYPLMDLTYLDSLSPETRRELLKLRKEFSFSVHNPDPLVDEKEEFEKYFNLLWAFQEYKDRAYTALCKWQICSLYDAIGNDQEKMKYLRAACSEFHDLENRRMNCQALGLLGSIYEGAGQIDSMITCYEAVKTIAHHCRLPGQAARITSFYAWRYARHGRLSLAHDLFNEAMELCRQYKGGYKEVRYIYEAMRFQADLGCWDIVDRLLKRARVLERECTPRMNRLFNVQLLRIDQIEARMKMAQGNMEEAEVLLHKIKERIEELHLPYSYRTENVELFYCWARGLLENGQPDKALNIVLEGFHRAVKAQLAVKSAQSALLMARIAFQLEDVQTMEWALQQFDSLALENEEKLQRESIEKFALLGRLALRNGDSRAAVIALEEGLGRLRNSVMNMDASVQSYLWIGACGDIRQLMHDIASSDPALGYGAELFWRDLFRLLGRHMHDGRETNTNYDKVRKSEASLKEDSDRTIIEDLRARAESAKDRLAAMGVIHSVYLIRDKEIWRWTAAPGGIHREILDQSTEKVQKLVADTWKRMSTENVNTEMSSFSDLLENLRTLAHLLLPPEIILERADKSEALFFITTDGFLSLIPFETFNIGSEGAYVPLLYYRDVAYLRHIDRSTSGTSEEPGVILVNAKPSKELRKRYPFQQALPEVLVEGKAVAALDLSARFLAGESATKSNLQSLWEDASFIYLATHTLRDPQVPYLMLIPLAVPTGTSEPYGPDAAYLDITDIRTADFSKCDIVVLSGCSSGAPYVEAGSIGPSLGDAFLDAGAGAVVQTFWDVMDEEARKLMTAYVQTWESPESSKIRALCNARRMALQATDEAQHPFRWASYSIKVGKL